MTRQDILTQFKALNNDQRCRLRATLPVAKATCEFLGQRYDKDLRQFTQDLLDGKVGRVRQSPVHRNGRCIVVQKGVASDITN